MLYVLYVLCRGDARTPGLDGGEVGEDLCRAKVARVARVMCGIYATSTCPVLICCKRAGVCRRRVEVGNYGIIADMVTLGMCLAPGYVHGCDARRRSMFVQAGQVRVLCIT